MPSHTTRLGLVLVFSSACSNSPGEPQGADSPSALSGSNAPTSGAPASSDGTDPEASASGNPIPSTTLSTPGPQSTPSPNNSPEVPTSTSPTPSNASGGTNSGETPVVPVGNAGAENSAGSSAENAGGANGNAGGGSGPVASGGNTNGSSGAGGSVTGNAGSAAQGGGGGVPQAEVCPKPAPEMCHEFFIGDNSRNELQYVNEFDPSQNWAESVGVTTANSPRQIALVDNAQASLGQAVLVSVDNGYQEYDMATGDRLVDVVVPGTTGVRGAVRLLDGDTVLSIGDDQLRVVDAAGETVRQCTLPGMGADTLRILHRDESGNLYFGRLLDLFGVDDSCQTQWDATLPTGGKAYSVVPREGGGAWASSGELCQVFEFDAQGELLSTVGGKAEHPDLGLDFFSGFQRLENGNIIAANWLGHLTPAATTPHLVELTPDNELVWTWGNQTLARQVSNVLVLR